MLKGNVQTKANLHGKISQSVVACNEADFLKIAVKETTTDSMIRDSAEYRMLNMKPYGHSWQKTTEGNQFGDFTRFQNTSIGGVTLTNNGDGSLTISGNGTLTSSFNAQVDYTHEETISLIRSGRLYALIETLVVPYLYLYLIYDNGNKKAELYCLSGTHEHTDITEEMLDDSCYLRIGFYGSTGDEIKSGTIKPMLYQDGDGTWEEFTHGASPNPYYPQPIESATEVKVLGGNLLDIPNKAKLDGDFYRIEEDGSISLQVTEYGDYRGKDTIPATQILKAGDYTLALPQDERTNDVCVEIYGKTTDFYRYAPMGSEVYVHLENDTEICFKMYTNSETIATNLHLMLNEGNVALPFEPYKEPQTLTFPTLHGIGDVRDYVDYERKKLVRRCVELTYDGNADWQIYDSSDYFGFYLTCLPEKMDRREGLCNQLIVDYAIGEGSKDAFWLGVANSTELYVIRNSFYDSSLSDKGLSNWKAHLNENPLKIVTYLAEPIEEDLTDEQISAFMTLHMNYPTTTIIGDAEITYVADTKNYIDKKLGYL